MNLRFVFLILFFFRGCSLLAQEAVNIDPVREDSMRMVMPERPEISLVFPGNTPTISFMTEAMPEVNLPEFDFTQYLHSRWKVDYSPLELNKPYTGGGFSAGGGFPLFPIAATGTVFNQASYRLSDKVLIGGNSFGINSLFAAPFPNSGGNTWEWRGAGMFMQYNVSGKFRIETHVSVTGHPYPH